MALSDRPLALALRGRAAGPPAPLAVLTAAAVAVAAELTVQRLLVRIGVHVPALPFLRGPYALVTETGSIAFTAAAVTALVALATTLWALSGRLPGRVAALVALAVAPFPALGLYAGFREIHVGWERPLALLYLLALAIAGAALLSAPQRGLQRAFGALLLAGLGLGAASGAGPGEALGLGVGSGGLGELALVTAAVLAPFAYRPAGRARRLHLAVAGAAGLMVVLAQVGNPATTNILLLWGLGLTGGLPFYLYAAAAAALAFAVVRLLAAGQSLTALGLLFVAMGGFGLHNTYQSSVQLLGVCVLLLATLEESPPPAADLPGPAA